jgi:uncharacterized protein YndB with AHSA1/START domain
MGATTGGVVSGFRIIRDYPHSRATLWRALTEPELVARWTTTGRGGRPVGFEPVVGNQFQLVAKPLPGWRGIVDCEVTQVIEPSLLCYTWIGDVGAPPSHVTWRLDELEDGTRLTFEHEGFTGVGGFLMSRLLTMVRRKMLLTGLPPVLSELDGSEHGTPMA